jgi:Fur family peroxide stress response transcriptional regulator
MKKLHKDISNVGLKVTPQRIAILEHLRNNQIHPTAEKIYHELLKDYPGISLTTVYNTLSRFVEVGMIKEVDIDPNKMRFDSCTDYHDHFHCRVCDNVYDIDYNASILADHLENRKTIQGHKVDAISINLKGVCKYCEATVSH